MIIITFFSFAKNSLYKINKLIKIQMYEGNFKLIRIQFIKIEIYYDKSQREIRKIFNNRKVQTEKNRRLIN